MGAYYALKKKIKPDTIKEKELIMSFGQFNKTKLLEIVKYFDVPGVNEENTKSQIEEAIKEFGITWAAYKKFETEQEEKESKAAESLFADSRILLKMDRQNPSFEAFGHVFTKTNPFALVDAEVAENIINAYEGFRVASPQEARSFYS